MPLAPLALALALETGLAGASAQPAPSPQPVKDVALTIYNSLDKQADRYIVRFTDDNIAEIDGLYKGQDGHFVGPVPFRPVAAIVEAQALCEQDGVSHVLLAAPSVPPSSAQTFFLRVHCDGHSKSFRPPNAAAGSAAQQLTEFLAKQRLRRTGASQIDQRILLGQ
jgi:hypothetical protein